MLRGFGPTLSNYGTRSGCGFRARRTAGRDVEPSFQPLEGFHPYLLLLEVVNRGHTATRHPTPPGERTIPSLA
ncbi:unnamed protein product [Ectocarpus sp. 4 AP-2014]